MNGHGRGGLEEINRRWQETVNDDTISKSTHEKIRSQFWLAGNGHHRELAGEEPDSPLAVESDLDGLIYRVMHLDDLVEVADALRVLAQT